MAANVSLLLLHGRPADDRAADAPVARAATRPGLLARCAAWIRRMEGLQRLRDMEPHLARDIGVHPGQESCLGSFAVDPRPLWGIGLTPRPAEALPPWPDAGAAVPRRCQD